MRVSISFSGQPISKTKRLIYLRVREKGGTNEKREQVVIPTGIKVENRYWLGSSKGISKKSPDYSSSQEKLNYLYKVVEGIVNELETNDKYPHPKIVKDELVKRLNKTKEDTFVPLTYHECWEKFLHKKKVETTFYTHRMYVQLYKRINEFSKHKRKTLSFEYILSDDFETDFKDWSWNHRNHTNSFVRKNLSSLKSFLNYCNNNNFIDVKLKNFKKPKVLERKEIVHFTKEEVIQLSETTKYDYIPNKTFRNEIVPIKDYNRFGTEVFYNNWELVKDIMVFMCISGCRWNDIHTLTWDSQNFDNETFTWENQKTKKYTTIPLDDIGIKILKKYGRSKDRKSKLFPSYSSVKFNENIKKILRDLNMNRLVSTSSLMGTKSVDTEKKPLYEVVSSHTGRRTFIMGLINKGLGYKEIMTFTGHTDVKSLMKYISFSEGSIEKGRNIFSGSENNQQELVRLYSQLGEKKQKMVLDFVREMV